MSDDGDEAPAAKRALGQVGRILAAASGPSAVALLTAAATGDPHLHALTALAAAFGALAQGRREFLPTTAERLDPVDHEADRELARTVPELQAHLRETNLRVDDAVAALRELHGLTKNLADEVRSQWEARQRRRVGVVGVTMLRLIADGEASLEDFDDAGGHARETVIEAMRFSLDAIRDEAVPMIARLTKRPTVDHFFRGACRLLVDLDAEDLLQLTTLIATPARAWPSIAASLSGAQGDPSLRLEKYDQQPSEGRRVYLRWRLLPNESGLLVRADSPIVPSMITHRLASAPNSFVPRGGAPTGGDELATWAFDMSSTDLLDLHFVLTGDRVTDPRTPA